MKKEKTKLIIKGNDLYLDDLLITRNMKSNERQFAENFIRMARARKLINDT